MSKYDSYKDSGVEWIGDIPSHWSKIKLSMTIYTTQGIQVDVPKQKYEKEFGYERFLRISDYTNPDIEHRYVNVPNLNNYIVNEDDIVMFRYGESGKVVKGLKGVICNNVFSISSKNHEMSNNYLFKVFSSNDFYELLKSSSNNPTLSQVSHSQIKEQKVPFPPLSEQQQIVEFLDTKTELIDSLIEKTERKIELLKEKRTSLINETVTKGLNPNVEMKDSGVEWIGEIPSDWKYGKVKFFMEYKKGYPFKSENMSDEGLPIIKVTSIKKLKINNPKTFFKGEFDDRITIVEEGDIIITTVGSKHEVSNSSVGQLGLVEKDQNGFLLNQNTVSIRTRFNSVVNNKFIFNYFQSKKFRNYLDIHSHGTVNQSSLNVDDILNFNIPYPPINEQKKIVEYLDEQTGLIDKTISNEEKRKELLIEYRQSLISEVVTGKRKVTN